MGLVLRPRARAAVSEAVAPPVFRREQTFPTLTAAQIARIRPFGVEREAAAGELIWEQGQDDVPFMVVLDGELEVAHPDLHGEHPIVTHGPGQFTGELNLITGRRALVRGRAHTALRLLAVERRACASWCRPTPSWASSSCAPSSSGAWRCSSARPATSCSSALRHSAGTLHLQEFLTRNGHPFCYVDVERDLGTQAMLDTIHVTTDDMPVVVCRGDRVLKNPTIPEVAECLGLNTALDPTAVRDLVVVGAGPAGLAAAVYAASEGLDVLVLEAESPGGQAGSSSKIENYLGFPTGISGGALAARAFTQAEKFGAEIVVARPAVRMRCEARPYVIELGDGTSVLAKTIVIATGAAYRKPDIADLQRFEGLGVYYGATHVEAQRCDADEVVIVGGGNSAGQAAVFLAKNARHVHLLVRGPGLADTMSRYLIRRIEEAPNVTLRPFTQIVALDGERQLERVTWLDAATGERTTKDIRHVFIMTGAVPNTGWVEGCVALDEKGFVKTGADLGKDDLATWGWPRERPPHLLETSTPGVFAVGDVRSLSVKRVASAVGEGAICVSLVHRALGE
ncbi:MAG: FAD-dependent oxidoreductase [Myxococcota bacterium]